MADNKDRDPDLFGKAHEHCCRFAHLRDAARRALHLRVEHGLDGVDDRKLRFFLQQCLGNVVQICLTQEPQIIAHLPDAVRTELDLPDRFLTGDIQHRVSRRGHVAHHLQEEC